MFLSTTDKLGSFVIFLVYILLASEIAKLKTTSLMNASVKINSKSSQRFNSYLKTSGPTSSRLEDKAKTSPRKKLALSKKKGFKSKDELEKRQVFTKLCHNYPAIMRMRQLKSETSYIVQPGRSRRIDERVTRSNGRI